MPALPPAPAFDLTPLTLPPYFCSEDAKTKYRFNVLWPYVTALRAQAAAWAQYDYQLSVIAAQYSDDPEIYDFVRKIEIAAAGNSRKARDAADNAEAKLFEKLQAMPVEKCGED